MNQTLSLEVIAEETAFRLVQENSPGLLQIIRTFVKKGFNSDEIVEILVERSGQPRSRYIFTLAGCVADYLINNPELATETIQ